MSKYNIRPAMYVCDVQISPEIDLLFKNSILYKENRKSKIRATKHKSARNFENRVFKVSLVLKNPLILDVHT